MLAMFATGATTAAGTALPGAGNRVFCGTTWYTSYGRKIPKVMHHKSGGLKPKLRSLTSRQMGIYSKSNLHPCTSLEKANSQELDVCNKR